MTMSLKERDRLQIIEAVREKRLKQRTVAERLGLSVRQVKRLVQAHRTQGVMGLLSKRRGQPNRRRIAEAERDRVVVLVRERYADFGPTLAAEYLRARHGFAHSVETLRQWMMQAELYGSHLIFERFVGGGVQYELAMHWRWDDEMRLMHVSAQISSDAFA